MIMQHGVLHLYNDYNPNQDRVAYLASSLVENNWWPAHWFICALLGFNDYIYDISEKHSIKPIKVLEEIEAKHNGY